MFLSKLNRPPNVLDKIRNTNLLSQLNKMIAFIACPQPRGSVQQLVDIMIEAVSHAWCLVAK